LIKSKPQFVDNIAKAIVESVAFILKPSNKKAVELTLRKHLRLDKADLVEDAYRDIVTGFPRKPCPTMRGVESVLKLMAQHGINPKASQLTPEDIVDPTICEKLDKSGFIDRLYQPY
jgi:hypothetical protein